MKRIVEVEEIFADAVEISAPRLFIVEKQAADCGESRSQHSGEQLKESERNRCFQREGFQQAVEADQETGEEPRGGSSPFLICRPVKEEDKYGSQNSPVTAEGEPDEQGNDCGAKLHGPRSMESTENEKTDKKCGDHIERTGIRSRFLSGRKKGQQVGRLGNCREQEEPFSVAQAGMCVKKAFGQEKAHTNCGKVADSCEKGVRQGPLL